MLSLLIFSLFINQDTVRIHAVGDVMMASHFPNSSFLPDTLELKEVELIFPELLKADHIFGNFEGVFLDEGTGRKQCTDSNLCYLFKTPTKYHSFLEKAGFTIMSLANNHSFDFGQKGQDSTVIYLNKANILYAGTAEFPYIRFNKNNINYAFIAFGTHSGMPQMNNYVELKKIINHLDSISDILIVSFHGGAEGNDHRNIIGKEEIFHGENRGNVKEFAHLVIDYGADLVLGHGPHVLRAVEYYKKKFIAYSLGNFWTYGRFALTSYLAISCIMKINIDIKGDFIDAEVTPIFLKGRGIPIYDPKNRAFTILKSLSQKDFPNNQLKFENNKISIKKMEPLKR
jgi:hypothetical protein